VNKVKALLLVLIALLQYRLWYGDGNVREFQRLNAHIAELRQEGDKRRERNTALEAEVMDLKQGLDAVEERARQDLEMIKEGEVYVQVVDPHHEPEFPAAPPKEKPPQPPTKPETAKGKPRNAAKPHSTESNATGKPKPANAKNDKTPALKPAAKNPPAKPAPARPKAAPIEAPPEEPVETRPPDEEPD
jgi:cell division protein FtsB